MLFTPLQAMPGFPPMWAARRGDYSFVISEEIDGIYEATARRAYTTEPHPVMGRLIEIGAYSSMTAAVEACIKWKTMSDGSPKWPFPLF